MSACLSEEAADEVARAGDVSRRTPAIAEHLDSCTSCRELVSALALVRAAEEAPPSKLREGAKLGRYVLVRLLGEGGMGVVWEADDGKLGRRVALKWIHPTRGVDADRERARLLREARMVAQLNHPNAVTVFDAGEIDGETFIAFELAPKGNLAAWLREAKRTPAAILDAFVQAGRGLSAAHQNRVIHGDFKAENVLLSADGVFKVTDFGLARAAGERVSTKDLCDASSATSTIHGGTPFYMSPERLAGGPASARSDQYSLALALWVALAGTMAKPGRSRLPDVPRSVERALRRALADDPNARFDSVGDFLAAVGARSRRWRWLAVAAVLVVATIGAGVRLRTPPALVANGGMEAGAATPTSWTLYGNTAGFELARLTKGSHAGAAHAALVPKPGGPRTEAWLSQAIDARPLRGKHLRAIGWARVEGEAKSAQLVLRARNVPNPGGGPVLDLATANISGTEWRRYELELDVPTSASFLDVSASVTGDASLFVDELSVAVIEVAPQPPRVKNGDFETAAGTQPADWDLSGNGAKVFELVRATEGAHGGTASALLQRKSADDPASYATVMQLVPVGSARDRRIRVSAWVRLEGTTTRADLWTRARGNRMGGDGLMLGGNAVKLAASSDWTRYEAVFDVPAETLYLDVGIGIVGDAKLWIDDVTVEIAP